MRGVTRAALVIALVLWFVFAVVMIALRYLVLPHVADYRTSIEGLASRALGETVTIGSLEASWRGLRPALSLRAVRIVDREGHPTLELPAVDATLAWESLVVLELRLARLEVDGPQLAISRDATGQLFVAGRPIKKRDTPDDRLAEWVLSQDEIRVRHARIDWHDEMPVDPDAGPTPPREIALSGVDLALVRRGWHHGFALRAIPPADLAAPIDVRASIDHPLFARFADTTTWKGELYANVASADIGLWREVVRLPASIEHGRGRVRSWVRFTDAATATSVANASLGRSRDDERTQTFLVLGRLSEVVADVALDDLAVREGASVRVALASIDGRVAASQDQHHQAFSSRGLVLRPVGGGPSSSSTDLAVRRMLDPSANGHSESGEATLNAVDITALTGLIPPGVLPRLIADKLAAYRPSGLLDRLTLKWNGPESNPDGFTFEGRFTKLAIAPQAPTAEAIQAASRTIVEANGLVRKPRPAFGQPGFENLSGTLRAGRTTKDGVVATTVDIALKSDDALVIAPGLFDDPRLHFAKVEAAIGIRMSGTDLELDVKHAVLENADLAASADVSFKRGPHSGSPQRGWVDVDAHLSRAEVGRVPRYLPNIVGEKARLYLSRALVAGKVVDATFRMKGSLESLNVRAQADSLAAANPVPLATALSAVRDHPGKGSTTAGGSDEPTLHAVVKVKNATYLYGPARSVEEITAAAAATGATLVQPVLPSVAWPAFEDVDADVIFDHASLKVVARTARFSGFRLTDVTVDLPAIADPTHVLRAVGRGTGPLQDLVRYANESPIARWTRNAFANAQAKGNATLAIALDLPLGHARDADLVGSIDLASSALALNPQVPPLTKLSGRVDFTDKGLTIAGLTGEALGGPVRFDATTHPDGLIEAKATGTVDAQSLRKAESEKDDAYSAPRIVERVAHRLDGSTPYTVAIRLHSKRVAPPAAGAAPVQPSADATMPDVVVDSTLKGLAINLPVPFDKKADESWPLHLEISRTAASAAGATRNLSVVEGEDVRMTIEDRVAVSISRHRNAQGLLAVTRAGYAVGRGVGANDLSGVKIDVPALDLDAWREVAKELAVPPPADAAATPAPAAAASGSALVASLVPDRIVLETGSLRGAGRDFGHVALDARRGGDGWQGDIVSDQVTGHVAYTDVSGKVANRNGIAPVSSGRVVARLSRLSIPKAESTATHVQDAMDATRQRDFPAIDLVADHFELRGRDLGRLEVVAENVGDDTRREWKLEKLGLAMPEGRFTANGAWGRGSDGERTDLTFAIDATNVGLMLDRLGVPKTIKDGTAKLTGHVGWNGGPTTIDFASMTGQIALETGKGQFLKVDPGIAKLLGVLSLQSIPRRLLLDFSDVFEAGFAFDAVTADATIERGVASTDNFKMLGPQANVMMSGTADLARETTDLHVLVLPQVNAGAASLGLALVNPVIGLATFAAQYLFKDPIARALSIEYNVAGPWTKPLVSKIDRDGHATPVAPRASPTANSEEATASTPR